MKARESEVYLRLYFLEMVGKCMAVYKDSNNGNNANRHTNMEARNLKGLLSWTKNSRQIMPA